MIKCFVCGTNSSPLFRQNQKGVIGVWACDAHNKIQDTELAKIVATVDMELNKPTTH